METQKSIASFFFYSVSSLFLCLAVLSVLSTALAHEADPFICPDDLPLGTPCANNYCLFEDMSNGKAFDLTIHFCPCQEDDCELIRIWVCPLDCPEGYYAPCFYGWERKAYSLKWNEEEQKWYRHSHHQMAYGQIEGLKPNTWYRLWFEFYDTSGNYSRAEFPCEIKTPDLICCWENGVSVPCFDGDIACFQEN